jgi:hypothetical protein
VSRLLAAALTALLLFAAVPASAQELVEEPTEEPAIVECENSDDLEVITREGLQTGITTPSFMVGNEVESKDFLVDLAATTTDATATIAVDMTWAVLVNDYDLEAYSARGGGASESWQPLDPAVESVAMTQVRHCEVIQVSAIDFLAPVVVDSLALDFRVSKFVDPGPAPVEPATDLTLIAKLLAQ